MAPKEKTKKRPFYYRRAKWDEMNKEPSLEEILTICHEELSTVGDRTFLSGEGEIRGADADPRPGEGLFLHIASYVPDEQTTTIEKSKRVKRSRLHAEAASAGRDFLSGDIFALVKDNHLILCPSGVRESVVHSYIYNVLKKCKYSKMLASFDLEKIAKASKLAMVATEGVKSIELGASLYDASISEINVSKRKASQKKIDELLKKAAELFEDMFAKDPNLKEIKEQENLNIKISLNFDGREARRKGKPVGFGEIGKSRLKKTSEEIIKEYEDKEYLGFDEDGFKIVTMAGNVITPTEIRVSDSYHVKVFGKSIDKSDTFDKLKGYYDRLKSSGVLAQ
ncbi:hypothetical protein [Pseudomonas aeruginosa]|uniref:hypothetical protein n=1 Tax=Pseudomonas aeruginosa TaxID=287 RepID=UPI0015C602BF|nr:hypothetical protein [Pseudomonas aeruginosa]NYB20734.1 hypothetical protein [Pseudomonas aeruginosa]